MSERIGPRTMELLEILVEELRRHDWAKDMDHEGLQKALELARHENERTP